jgi:hypothetical protein
VRNQPRPIVSAAVAAVAAAGLAAAAGAASQSTAPPPPNTFISFRLDDYRVVAVVKVFDDPAAVQFRDGLSPEPAARYGFRVRDIPSNWRDRIASDVASAEGWTVHAAPGARFKATAERLIGGNAQCRSAVGVLLEIPAEEREAFARVRARYYVAAAGAVAPEADADPAAGTVTSTLSEAQQSRLEQTLSAVLARELPAVIKKAAADPARESTDAALLAGTGRLVYDVQAYRLAPGTDRTLFVRARWFVGTRLGFAAAVWLRDRGDDGPFEIVEQTLDAASWLRMSLFRYGIHDSHLGLVLNVLDSDGDGWGEILFAREGYESVEIGAREFSPAGFVDGGPTLSQGC